ncbi:hypothetical protein [Candidatus Protochlamydia phocaeensis]|uniref:hypothetical protein n=1 Tax=Candidatus Protochlamydia phocaeensis TaxID=1414722 RepID=UPI0012ABB3CD|nr:hypothetical protein [Candidatus Protochlamydia phocaeensis]
MDFFYSLDYLKALVDKNGKVVHIFYIDRFVICSCEALTLSKGQKKLQIQLVKQILGDVAIRVKLGTIDKTSQSPLNLKVIEN